MACLFINQVRESREKNKAKKRILINLEQAKNHSHGNFADRLNEFKKSSMVLNFFYCDEMNFQLRDSPREFEQRNNRVDIKYDIISDSKTEIRSSFIKNLTDTDVCYFDAIK